MEVTEASVLLLPFAAASVGVARRRLVSDLIAADVYDSAVCDVALVISELFSNALRHAAPLPGSKIRVAWRIDPGSVQVSVSDGGGTDRSRAGRADAGGDRGPGAADRGEAVQPLGHEHRRGRHHGVGRGAGPRGTGMTAVGVPVVATEGGCGSRDPAAPGDLSTEL